MPRSPTAVPGRRSASLVGWVRSWRAGLISYDEVGDEVRTWGGEHLIAGLPGREDERPLADGLAALSRLHPDEVRLVLPAPGDPRGLPGAGPFADAALEAGEAVLCGGLGGLVPSESVHVSGSGDRWAVVRWQGHPVPPGRADPLTPADADHELTVALRDSLDALRRLDLARAGPDLATAVAALRRDTDQADLPAGYGERARRLYARATTVVGIIGLAAADAPGAAVSAYEAAERDAALRPLAAAARRAVAAAVNAPLE